jgi:hypothetical protein
MAPRFSGFEKFLMNRFKSSPAYRTLGALASAVLFISPAMGQAPTKEFIEVPTKEVIAARSGNAAVLTQVDNPKVAPGQVIWHPSFAAACDASRVSRKPVLLFQMMGKLDEQFC